MNSTITEVDVSGAKESSSTAVSWGPIIAGALAASTLTIILMLVGSGLGLTMVSPWTGATASIATFAVSAAVWLVVVQWLSAGLGGYLTGRLRTKWVGVHDDEVYFRDTAHGFLAWALATLLVAGVLGSALSAAVGAGVQATSNVASAAAAGATSAAANAGGTADSNSLGYFVDALFRPADAGAVAPAGQNDAGSTAQASRILVVGAARGEVSADDKSYLAKLVASRTGLSQADAAKRVDTVLAGMEDAKNKAKAAADTARKASATFALVGALSMIVGAFIASVAATLGGKQRDDDEAHLVRG
ncbi:hypothetical protein RFM68_31275 [Mesorhizobium sp. MSK_1335]|uniref:Mll5186 protein n=1 Tax=Mesorhizobium montanum TaxID=3072323 RepID=A0ABU4ZY59_9HYPH|nr:hypothetical protein [Mesorhizobium sp. MSK_1335]MDX8528958.1 hypothetical protein [Mesorhizobium sp. MSK_1335]